jgi:hypothetical protein
LNRGQGEINDEPRDCGHRVLRPVTVAMFHGESGASLARTQDEGAVVFCVEDEDAASGVPGRGNSAKVAGRSTSLGPMGSKSKPTAESKKPGRSIKEKRAAKHQKQAEQKETRKGWDAK